MSRKGERRVGKRENGEEEKGKRENGQDTEKVGVIIDKGDLE